MASYFKITNASENHHGFQYKDGLNILEEEFNDNAEDTCCEGGLYFTDLEHISDFYSYGIYLREVFLPTDDPKFQMVMDPSGDKWRASRIILGEKYSLGDIQTYIKFKIKVPSLEYVVKNGFFELYQYLTQIFRMGSITLPLFYTAIEHGHMQFVQHFVGNKTNKKIARGEISIGIIKAARYGYLDIIKYLVENGGDVTVGNDGRDSLTMAAAFGHLDIIKYLFENGTFDTSVRRNAIKRSIVCNKIDVTKYFLEKGETLTKCVDEEVIDECVDNGCIEMIKLLIDNGIKIEGHDNALFEMALDENKLDNVRYFVDHGFKVVSNETLVKCIKKGNIDIVKYLIDYGMDMEFDHDLALKTAATCGHLEIIKHLVEKNDNILSKNNALIKAAIKGHSDIVTYLVDNGADIHAKNENALKYAAKNGHLQIVTYLVDKGADINCVNGNILYAACVGGYYKIVEYLVKKGANVNAKDGKILSYCATKNYLHIVKLLLDNGAVICNSDESMD